MARTITPEQLGELLQAEVNDIADEISDAIARADGDHVELSFERLEKWQSEAASLTHLRPVKSLLPKVNKLLAETARWLHKQQASQPEPSQPEPQSQPELSQTSPLPAETSLSQTTHSEVSPSLEALEQTPTPAPESQIAEATLKPPASDGKAAAEMPKPKLVRL